MADQILYDKALTMYGNTPMSTFGYNDMMNNLQNL